MNALAGAGRAVATIRPSRELYILGSVTALSAGSTITFGFLAPASVALVVTALVLMALSMSAPDQPAGTAWWAAAGALTASASFVYAVRLALPVEGVLAVALVMAVVVVIATTRPVTRWVAAAVAVTAVVGMAAAVWQWGVLNVDVFNSVQNATWALLHGTNPYITTFATPVEATPSSVAFVNLHFQYLPGVALIAAPARLLGDVRVMSVVAAAALAAFAVRLALQSDTRRERAVKVGAVCLALPMTVAMVHYALVDVFSMAGFAGWIALRRTHPRWAVACLAVSLTIKPTILVALVAPTLWSRRARREVSVAAVAAFVVILPFLLITGAGAFYQDVIGVQASLGFRYNGLTLSAAWYALSGHLVPVWFGVLCGGAVAVFVLRRRPRDVGEVMQAGALLSTAAFLLAKWAFLNYYFIPVWLLVLSLAGRGVLFETRPGDIALPRLWPGALLERKQLAAQPHGGA